MYGFLTKSGTRYILDVQNQMICGGKLKNPVHYTYCSGLIIGCRPTFNLINGQVLKTSAIVSYL